MKLRPYQQEAVAAVYRHLRSSKTNPCVVIPTAGGKTPIIASICSDAVMRWHGRVIVLAHVKELLEQAVDKLRAICPGVRIGVYSAGLGRRDTNADVIVAGIQSVYKRAHELGPFNLVIVDEAHLIPASGEGMYRSFLSDQAQMNPRVRVIGLTATPYRLDSGFICDQDNILHEVCYEVGVRDLIEQGYLCRVVSKCSVVDVDTSKLHVRGGEFVASEAESLMDEEAIVTTACSELIDYTADRHSVLIFACGIKHAEHIQQVLQDVHGVECGIVTGETPAAKRQEIIERFKAHPNDMRSRAGLIEPLKYLVNVNVLTTGFDAPSIDCIALMRPTMSPGLYYQMIGRGFRLYKDKRNCLILDYAGNILRHGPVDLISPGKSRRPAGEVQEEQKEERTPALKVCGSCRLVVDAKCTECPECGAELAVDLPARHDTKAANAGVMSDETAEETHEVHDVLFRVHRKRDSPDDAPRSMRVDYMISLDEWVSEWVCFEHKGYARRKAEQWWAERSNDPIPSTAQQAVDLAEAGALALTKRITIARRAGSKYWQVVGHELGEKPPAVEQFETTGTDEIPF